MGGCYNRQKGNGYQLLRSLKGPVRAGLDHFQLQHPILAQTGPNRGQNPHQIVAAQPGPTPEIPTLRISGDIAQLNVDIGGRFLNPSLPT
jgi:hypothetical protein